MAASISARSASFARAMRISASLDGEQISASHFWLVRTLHLAAMAACLAASRGQTRRMIAEKRIVWVSSEVVIAASLHQSVAQKMSGQADRRAGDA
jgi:hypothetical protein